MNTKAIKVVTGAGFLAAIAISTQGNAQTNFFRSGNPTTQVTTAQVNEFLSQINTITTAVPFLMITPDSRAGGMGETG
ncbi:MAG TPA: hypothetical protein VFJ43_02315, partial [Bacteroidia bacterium]|nr:hypothetical protein [Bacteroidia bacterium]